MAFGNPWMLLGLLLALVPVAVHLFGRRKAPLVHFSALAFILASNPKKARALQISEWLLVALRSLAVALVAVALARPMLPVLGAAEGFEAGEGPVGLVVVLDDSMSTLAKAGGEPLFERARAKALALVERLPNGSKVAAVASGYPARLLLRQPTEDRGAVLDALRRLEHRPRRDDAARALGLAQALLDATGLDDRRVVLFSDLQKSGWQGVQAPWRTVGDGKGVQLRIDRLVPETRENTAVVDALATPAAERGPNQVRVEVTLRHHGQQPFRNYLTVRAGDREIKSLVQLQPGETLRRSYVVPGSAQVAEILLPPDGLDADNRRLLRLDGGAAVRVALVNGAPRPVPREDEVFFAARALELSAAHAGEMSVDVLQLPGLNAAALEDYDVLVLANVGELPQTLVQDLRAAVQAGKGLLVTVGDNLPADLAEFLPGLVPAPLHGLRSTGRRTEAAGGDGEEPADALPRSASPVSVRIVAAGTQAAPPAVQQLRTLLQASVGEALTRSAVHRYALVQPSPQVTAHTALRYSDGAPALVLAPHGRGLVALLTTTLDRDWTDLPLQPGFLPLLHDVAVTLAGDRGLERRSAVEVGDVAVLSRDDRADQLEVKLETATATGARPPRLLLAATAQHGRGWQVAGLEEPGRYTATELRGGTVLTARSVIAVPPASESHLEALQAGPLHDAQRANRPGTGARPKAPAWSAVLVLLLVLLGLEGWVLVQGVLRRPARA